MRYIKPNRDIRLAIKEAGICTWQVAGKMGLHENSLYRRLRKEFDEHERKQIYSVINELKDSKDGVGDGYVIQK